MKNEKKEFNKAEVEVVRFEKTDVITTSTETGCNIAAGTAFGGGANPGNIPDPPPDFD